MIRLTAVIEIEGKEPRALTYESNARSIILGRDASADFQLPLSTVSRRHARIIEADNVYFLEDLSSTHGTLCNGQKIAVGEKKVLKSGDVIELTKAKITCVIEAEQVALADPGEGTQAIAVRAVQGILGRLGEPPENEGPFFRVLNGSDEGRRFFLTGPTTEWSIGRTRDCAFILSDVNVSRRHALVRKDWHGFTIEDLGSKNGVVVNERKIKKPKRLKDRDEVIIGPIKLLFLDPDADLLAALKDVPGFALENSEAGVEEENVAVAEPAGELAPKAEPSGVSAADSVGNATLDPSAAADPSPLAAEAAQASSAARKLGEEVSSVSGSSEVSAVKAGSLTSDKALVAGSIAEELLTPESSRSFLEWLIILSVTILIIASIVLLSIIF